MGKIEDVIYENYKKSIEDGDLEQASKAVEFAGILKNKIESEGFVDYNSMKVPASRVLGGFFNPLPYKYDPENGVVELPTSAIVLTPSENKLFYLFSNNETRGKDVRIITNEDIAEHMWGQESHCNGAIRIAVYRLRKKLEPDPENPQTLVSLPARGYIFLGNKVTSF